MKDKITQIKEVLEKNEKGEGNFVNYSYTLGCIKAIVDLPEREKPRLSKKEHR